MLPRARRFAEMPPAWHDHSVIEIPLSRVVHYPMPGLNAPAALQFSPDGRLLTYLWSEDGTLVRQLWAYDRESAETRAIARAPGEGDTDAPITPEETLRRERLRMRGFGITAYAWAERANVFIVPSLGEVYSGSSDGELIKLNTGGGAIDPRLEPGGSALGFVRDGELWVLDLRAEDALPRRLTFDASQPNALGERLLTNGLAEFIAQEEMGRGSGFWWSPDGRQLAFAQVDNSDVTPFSIVHQSDDAASVEVHRYPFAGGANAKVRIGIVRASGSEPDWVPLSMTADFYLARVNWAPDGSLFLQVQRRDQRQLDLLRYRPDSHAIENIISENSDTWINLHDDLRFPESDGPGYQIVWSSERSGFRHLYLYSSIGDEIRQLTHGDWMVDRVIDVRDRWVYFLAGLTNPLERHVYRVSLSGGELEHLSPNPGMHAAVLSPAGDCFADAWDSAVRPPSVCIRDLAGAIQQTVFAGDSTEATELELVAPEFLQLAADDGVTLYGALYRPPGQRMVAAPLLVSVYGGPHVQQVTNSWSLTVDLRAQYLARRGFAVLKLDNRGSARRGHAFEAAISGDLGNLEVQDQVAAIRFLEPDDAVDCSRVGIYGWSYGGYMALMCLLRAPAVFQAGVAGAPVTDWSGYDTHYTERYMRTPAENPGGYAASSALRHAASLAGRVLLIHGMIDENVHFRHTVRFVTALIQAGKRFNLLPFPSERHMPRSEEGRLYMEERLIEHFEAMLGDGTVSKAS